MTFIPGRTGEVVPLLWSRLWSSPAGHAIVVGRFSGRRTGPGHFGIVPVNETATKPECARDRHLFGPGPKRILSLDGGGVRGAIPVAFLEQIEKVLTENLTKKVRLGNYFDLVSGTSTSRSRSKGFAGATKSTRLPSFWLKSSKRSACA